MQTRSSFFTTEAEKSGYQPVWLVELPQIGFFYSTRDVSFTGYWSAGDGGVAGTGITAGSAYPTFSPLIAALDQGGIGTITTEIGDDGTIRTSRVRIRILDDSLRHQQLIHTPIRIRVGFVGTTTWSDYLSVFWGRVESWELQELGVVLECVASDFDTRYRMFYPLGEEGIFEGAPQGSRGKAIPIFLGGYADGIAGIPVEGDVEGRLYQAIGATDTTIYVEPVDAPWPEGGSQTAQEIRIDDEEMSYTTVDIDVVDGVLVKKLSGITRGINGTTATSHATGREVLRWNTRYAVVIGLGDFEVVEVNEAGVSNPGWTKKQVPVDRHLATILYWDYQPTDAEFLVWQKGTNLVNNGDFEQDTSGWTVESGAIDRAAPTAPYGAYWGTWVLKVQHSLGNAASSAYQDVSVSEGNQYLLHGALRPAFLTGADGLFTTEIEIGTPTASQKYAYWKETWQNGDSFYVMQRKTKMVKIPTGAGTTARYRVRFDHNGTTPTGWVGYFDALAVWRLSGKNAITVLQSLIQTYLPDLLLDTNAWNAAATARSGWNFAGLLEGRAGGGNQTNPFGEPLPPVRDFAEQEKAVLTRLASQVGCRIWEDSRGEITIKAIDLSAAADYTFTEDNIVAPPNGITVSGGTVDNVYTDIFVYYQRRVGAGSDRNAYRLAAYATPEKDNHRTQDLASLCKTAQDTYGIRRRLEVLADAVWDIDTAEQLLSFLVNFYTRARITVTFRSWLNAVHLEVGDIVAISNRWLPQGLYGSTFEVRKIQIMPSTCEVLIEAVAA